MMENKDAASVKIFPPAVPLVTILVGVFLHRVIPMQFGFGLPFPIRSVFGWSIVVLSILLLGLWSVFVVRKGGQSENPWKPTTEIVKHGPFKVTRNPMYLQMILVCVGVSVALGNLWILLLTPIAVFILVKWVIVPEEKYLEDKFGETYLSYKKRTRRWL